MKQRIVALLLFVTLLVSAFATTAYAIVSQNPVYTEGGTVEGKEDAFPAIQEGLADYQVGETKSYTDEYIGIPYQVTVYNDATAKPVAKDKDHLDFLYETSEPNPYRLSADGKPVVYYVINTNTERIGTDSDVDIIKSLLLEGYIVLVVDYLNEKRARTPDLDWSLQKVRTHTAEFVGDLLFWAEYDYIVPAGYTIRRGVQYFNYVESGVDGVLECMVEIWNIDLKRTSGDYNRGTKWSVIWGQKELVDGTLVYQDSEGKRCIRQGDGYVYYTQNADYTYTVGEAVADPSSVTPLYKKTTDDVQWLDEGTRKCQIRYAIAEDWWDMVKANGERVDFNLYLDITYPTNPENEVPVMMLASSSELRSSATRTATRPISTGFLFTGYAFVNYDHAYTPMARDDHFGYFEGESTAGRRNGFTVNDKTGVESQTAAVRCVRALGEMYAEEIRIDLDKFGAWGHSKGASVNRLGTAHPELETNDAYVSGHHGECSGTQPWLTYTDGTPIPSNIQLVYSSNGGGTYNTYPDAPPTVITQGEVDGAFTSHTHYSIMLHALRSFDTPALDMSMEGVGHTTIYGYNEERDYDMYQALFDFCNYFLKDEASVCEYILPKNGTVNVGLTDDIIVKFTGPIPESEIEEKVKVRNNKTGEVVRGVWTSAFGGNEWTFSPFHLEGGAVYTVEVPADLIGENNKAIKSGKTAAFRTAYESQFGAAEVTSTDGSLTLSKTESGANGIYFIFSPIEAEHNIETTLRFSVTNKASTLLRVWGVTSLAENRAPSTLTSEPISDVGVAGNEIVEVNVSEYIASLPEGATPAFYVETVKEAGTSTTLFYDLNDKSTSPSIVSLRAPSGWENPVPNGTRGFKAMVGHFVTWQLPALTEIDYGRRITITFEVYSTMERAMHTYMTVANNPEDENGEYYVDYYNDAYTVDRLKVGEWQTITLEYLIDDIDYVKDDVQKRKIYIEFTGENNADQFVYIDNIRVNDTVVDATIGATDSANSILPTLAVKTAEDLAVMNNGAGYVVSGTHADTTFDGKDGYLVSGAVEGVPQSRLAMTYVKADLRAVTSGMPYVLSFSVTGGSGAFDIYGIADSEMCENIDIKKLNFLNAPAFDRSLGKPNPAYLYQGEKLGTLDIYGAGDYQFTVTDYIQSMKGFGYAYAAFIIMAADGTDGAIYFDFTPAKKTSFNTVINALNFDKQNAFDLTTNRDLALYDQTDIYMQGGANDQNTYPNNGANPSSTIYRGTSGQSLQIQAPNNGYNVYKFLKLVDTKDFVFTEADLGNTYTITFSIYLEKASAKNPYMGLASTAASATYDGSDVGKLHQKVSMKDYLKVGEWADISYTFTVDEAMITGRTGESGATMKIDGRPVHFAIFGMRDTTFYIDNLALYQSLEYKPEEYESTLRTFIDMEGKSGMTGNGFEPIDNGDGTTSLRISYSELDNTTYGGKYAYRVLANKSYNRIYATKLFSLTSDNVGDTFTVTFKMKSNKANSMEVMIGDYSYTGGTAFEGMPPKAVISITADEVGKWVTKSYTFTVTEGVIATGYSGLRFNLNGFGSANSELFFDDFVCMRKTGAGGIMLPVGASKNNELLADNYIVTEQDFEGSVSYTPNGWEKMTLEDGTQVLRYGKVDTENTTRGGSYSYWMQHDKTYNRLFFHNMFPAEYITTQNIGDVYTVTFMAKVSRAGSFYLSPAHPASDYSGYTGMPTMGTMTFTEDQVGKWVSMTYTFTVTEGMVNAPYKYETIDGVKTLTETAPATSLRVHFSGGFGKKETAVYLDDFVVYRNLPANAVFENSDDLKTVASDTLVSDENAPAASTTPGGIHKFFFSYSLKDFLFAHKATIALNAKEHQGQTFSLWALESIALPENLTYNNIVANDIGEGILKQYAFGGAPVATFTFDDNGKAIVDVTAYVKEHLGESAVFAVTAEDGSMKYLDLDMSKADLVLLENMTSTGALTLEDGKLNVTANSVTLNHAFASESVTIVKGQPVTITVYVTSANAASYTITVDGTKYTKTLTPENGKVSFTFTPDTDISASSITVTADAFGFAISKMEIASVGVAVLEAPELIMYRPDTPLCTFDGVVAFHNVEISENLIYNLYLDESKGAESVIVGGKTIQISTLPEKTISGKVYRLLSIDTVAKYSLGFEVVTVTLADGSSATYDIGIRNYLAQLLDMAKTDEEYHLASDMLSYLVASVVYFYQDVDATVSEGAERVLVSLLGEGYDEANPSALRPVQTPAYVGENSGMKGAGLNLAERPTFYFVADDAHRNETPRFFLGEKELTYAIETDGTDVYYLLAFSPCDLTETVKWTVGDCTGEFNLRAYYDYASEQNDDALIRLIERVYRYSESVNAYFATK